MFDKLPKPKASENEQENANNLAVHKASLANFVYNNMLQYAGISSIISGDPLDYFKSKSMVTDGMLNNEEGLNITDLIQSADLVINIPKKHSVGKKTDGYLIRRCAIDNSIPLMTNIKNTKLYISTIKKTNLESAEVFSWQEYIRTIGKW